MLRPVYGIKYSHWERLPLDIKGTIAIGWQSQDLNFRRNLQIFFSILSEENKLLMLEELYVWSGYNELVCKQ
jgi:hypothetical protein